MKTKVFDSFENYFESLIPSELKGKFLTISLPSINHCLGIGKLLGEYFGRAITFSNPSFKIDDVKKISELSMLGRAYVVIDDYLKDVIIEDSIKEKVNDWLINVEIEILSYMKFFEPLNFEKLWHKYLKTYNDTFFFFNKEKVFNDILNKCCLTFLPFEFSIINDYNLSKHTKHCIEYYLFSLQLIDDFQDIAEDIIAPQNHNLFLITAETRDYKVIEQKKVIFLNSLFDYITENLTNLDVTENKILKDFFNYSTIWIRKNKINNSINDIFFSGHYENYDFNYRKLLSYKEEFGGQEKLLGIRAENMHTII